MNDRQLEFRLVLVVLGAFCVGTLGLIVALFFKIEISPAVPLIDGTLGTLAMAMWKDYSHSNQDRTDNQPQEKVISISTPEVKNV